MSVKVDLDQLADALGDFTVAYLISDGDDVHAHTVAVDPVFADGVLDVGTVGRSTRRNVTQHGNVTMVWPPREPGGYTLIVGGQGRLEDSTLRVTPTSAVLHRRATPEFPAAAPGRTDDCVPLDG